MGVWSEGLFACGFVVSICFGKFRRVSVCFETFWFVAWRFGTLRCVSLCFDIVAKGYCTDYVI